MEACGSHDFNKNFEKKLAPESIWLSFMDWISQHIERFHSDWKLLLKI